MIIEYKQDCAVKNGVFYISYTIFRLFSAKSTYSNKRPEDSDVIKANSLCFLDFTFNENETALLFSSLLIARSLCLFFDEEWRLCLGCLANIRRMLD